MTNQDQNPTMPNAMADRPAPGGKTIGATSPQQGEGLERDPEDWVTGDEPMTAAQRSYLDALGKEAGEELPADLTKAQASEHIDRLQQKTGRPPAGQS
ncbi:hypothetical protein GCM10027418_17200 [Mariniluteicoccus endophyticus]